MNHWLILLEFHLIDINNFLSSFVEILYQNLHFKIIINISQASDKLIKIKLHETLTFRKSTGEINLIS